MKLNLNIEMLVPRIQHIIDLLQLELDAFAKMQSDSEKDESEDTNFKGRQSWQSRATPEEIEAWKNKMRGLKKPRTSKQRNAAREWWNNASEAMKKKRLKAMRDGRLAAKGAKRVA
jgi:hypothetical protein